MPDGSTYELTMVTLLHGEAQRSRFYYIQTGPDPGAGKPEDDLIDSFEAGGAEAAWQVWTSDQAAIICYSAQEVLPSVGNPEEQFKNAAGGLPEEALPPKAKVLRRKYAPDPAGHFTRNSNSRHWFMGIPVGGTLLGQLTEAKQVEIEAFDIQCRGFPSVGAPGTFYDEANVTARTPAGVPTDSAKLTIAHILPRVYNLRKDTLKVCGAA